MFLGPFFKQGLPEFIASGQDKSADRETRICSWLLASENLQFSQHGEMSEERTPVNNRCGGRGAESALSNVPPETQGETPAGGCWEWGKPEPGFMVTWKGDPAPVLLPDRRPNANEEEETSSPLAGV